MRARDWLPPVTWMAIILLFATDAGSTERTGGLLLPLLRWLWPGASPETLSLLHGLARKAGHLVTYALLAALWFRALRRGPALAAGRSAALAFVVSVVWACLDEGIQTTSASRTGSLGDVGVDAAGAAAAALVSRARSAPAAARALAPRP